MSRLLGSGSASQSNFPLGSVAGGAGRTTSDLAMFELLRLSHVFYQQMNRWVERASDSVITA
jgi:hypothetical protein